MSDTIQATIARELRRALRHRQNLNAELQDIKGQLERIEAETSETDRVIKEHRAALDGSQFDLETGKPKDAEKSTEKSTKKKGAAA